MPPKSWAVRACGGARYARAFGPRRLPAPIQSLRRRSRNGQYGSDSPYETRSDPPARRSLLLRQLAQLEEEPALCRSPASPATTRTPPRPCAKRSASSAPAAEAELRERPTSRASTPGRPRCDRPVAATPATGQAATGPLLPFSSSSRPSPHSETRLPGASRRPRGRRPGSAADWRRAATFTVSPKAAYRPKRTCAHLPHHDRARRRSNPDAEPLGTPTPNLPGVPPSRRRDAERATNGPLGVVLPVVGAPKNARTPSPARSFTRPPSASTSPMIRVTASPTTSLTSSSSRSASGVEPTTSAKTAVGPSVPPARRWSYGEVRRSARGSPGGARHAP